MSNVFVMPICPHHRQYPGSVWAVKKYCFEFGIGINLDNNCYNCLVWQKTVRHDVSWVWLGQIGTDVKMICWTKPSYKTVTNAQNCLGDDASFFWENRPTYVNTFQMWKSNFKFRSGDDASFFQEKRLTYGNTVQISKRTKNAWGVMFPFSKKAVCSTWTPFKFQNTPQLDNSFRNWQYTSGITRRTKSDNIPSDSKCIPYLLIAQCFGSGQQMLSGLTKDDLSLWDTISFG